MSSGSNKTGYMYIYISIIYHHFALHETLNIYFPKSVRSKDDCGARCWNLFALIQYFVLGMHVPRTELIGSRWKNHGK